jgi:hypothetical protein
MNAPTQELLGFMREEEAAESIEIDSEVELSEVDAELIEVPGENG